MLLKQLVLTATFAAVSFASALSYAADEANNPLHPSYYTAKSQGPSSSGTSERYADAGNPLHPAYFAKGGWVMTGSTEPYVNRSNPLHPAFQK